MHNHYLLLADIDCIPASLVVREPQSPLERFGFGAGLDRAGSDRVGSDQDGSGGRIGVLIFENAKYLSSPTSFKTDVWQPEQFQWKLFSLLFGQNVGGRENFGAKS